MIQIFTLNKVVTKAEVVDEGEAEVVGEGVTAVEVEGDSVDVVEEATIHIEFHEKHLFCKNISY